MIHMIYFSNVKSAVIVVSGPLLHIPGTVDEVLNSQLINAILTQVVIDNFFSNPLQDLPVIVQDTQFEHRQPFSQAPPTEVIHAGRRFIFVSVTPAYAFCTLLQDTKNRFLRNQPGIIFYKNLADYLVQTMTDIVVAHEKYLLSEPIIVQKCTIIISHSDTPKSLPRWCPASPWA